MVGLSALVAGAAIAGVATILSAPSGTPIEVPVAAAYDGAGKKARQTDLPGSADAAALAAPGAPPGSGTTSPTTSSSAATSSTAPAPSSSATTSSSSQAPPPSPTSPTKPQDPAPPPPPQQPSPGMAGEVVDLVNQKRAGRCAPLSVDDRLTTSAQKHSSDMAARNYFSHTTPEGVTFDQRIKAAGYPRPGAENIAKGQRTAAQVMDSWMKSDGHRANILNCSYKKIGVGIDTNGFYWTQNFGF
nr:CAP domain-containing protein [Kibdelosporangium phytohabitans]